MTTDLHAERILILDFGSQYTQLIARRVRELGVYCELHPFTMSDDAIRAFNPAGIVLSGGPESVTSDHTPRAPQSVFELGCPVLGICYGMQTMAHQLQGSVANGAKREFGKATVLQQYQSPLLQDVENEFTVWMSHGDHVEKMPEGFSQIASSGSSGITAMADEARRFYGLQFHPEVSHTPDGLSILKNFVLTICGCKAVWTTDNIIEESLQKIRDQVGSDHVILGLSGGVDSSVVAALLHRAIGEQLTCVFVDNGLLRLNEAAEVQALFAEHLKMKLIVLSAEELFLTRLKGVTDPEQKRKVIGQLFVELFEQEASKIDQAKWLAQGTIYPDVIESATQDNATTHTIKSHHNVGGLPENMTLKLLEPLRELFKDEVRHLGLRLGLPETLIYRHPFPGPGLGVRILGEVHKSYADTLRLADAILIEELHAHDLYNKVSQAFVVFLPIKSVGVLGDARHYDHVLAVRVVETSDFMTARWSHLPYDFLETVSSRIINEVPGVSRVTYDISNKPPATIEWE